MKASILLPVCLLSGTALGLTLRANFSGFGTAALSGRNPAAFLSAAAAPGDENPMLPITRKRLEAFRNAGPPVEQVAFALRFSGMDNAEEIQDLLERQADFPPDEPRHVAVSALLKSWLRLDPAAARDFCLRHHKNLLPQFIGSWSRDHPAEAADWLKTLPHDTVEQKAWFARCHSLAAKNPAAAWESFAGIPGLTLNAGSFDAHAAIARMVDMNVDQAINALSTMPPAMLGPARLAVAATLMRTDPSRGWEWARSQATPGPVVAVALTAAMRREPARALNFLKSLSPEEFAQLRDASRTRWKTGDLPAAAHLLKTDSSLPDEFRQFAAAGLFEGLLYSDPADCALLFPLLSPEAQLEKAGGLSAAWADQDPAATRTWIEGLPPGPLREAAQAPLALRQAAPDPNSPERLVAEFNAGGSVFELDPRLPRLTPSHLSQMMTNLEGEHFFEATQLIRTLGAIQPETVAAWLSGASINREISPIAKVFTAQWAAADPAAAAEWVKTLPPDGPLPLLSVRNVAFEYHRYAPREAVTWLNSLPAGPLQDNARAVIR